MFTNEFLKIYDNTIIYNYYKYYIYNIIISFCFTRRVSFANSGRRALRSSGRRHCWIENAQVLFVWRFCEHCISYGVHQRSNENPHISNDQRLDFGLVHG